MPLQHLSTAPATDEFTPLREHQEQTPTTFFGAKPVLYAHYADLTLSTLKSQLEQNVTLSKFSTEGSGDDVLIKDVTIWVNSEDLVLFQSSPTPTGVAIPYQSIALHATMKYKSTIGALFMSVSLSDYDQTADADMQALELTILPPSYESNPDAVCIKDIFNAMNTCADLHPDADASGDEDGDDLLDDSAPGASGWITADNLDEYMDENGNFVGMVMGDNELGPGAGNVRQRDEEDGANGVDGHEGKYYRTG